MVNYTDTEVTVSSSALRSKVGQENLPIDQQQTLKNELIVPSEARRVLELIEVIDTD